MKTAIIIILALCLGLSLWINRENKTAAPPPPPVTAEALPEIPGAAGGASRSSGALPKTDTIDFSGTAFSDDAWKLDNSRSGAAPGANAGTAPSSLDSSAFKLELPTTLPTLDTGDSTPAGTGAPSSFKSLLTNPGSN
ncbi:MAG: hypothetical protein V4726_17735 [Verrucomicrobiota bacterium]